MLKIRGTIWCDHNDCESVSGIILSPEEVGSLLQSVFTKNPKWLPEGWTVHRGFMDAIYRCPLHK